MPEAHAPIYSNRPCSSRIQWHAFSMALGASHKALHRSACCKYIYDFIYHPNKSPKKILTKRLAWYIPDYIPLNHQSRTNRFDFLKLRKIMSLKANDRLFDSMSALSKQHAENSGESGQYHYGSILDNGKIDVVFPPAEPEPAPTVSLYNLLDHSVADLAYLLHCVRKEIAFMYPYKKSNANAYTSICAWATILETAHKEACKKDSEAWAEKTAKEILGNDNCGPEHNV